MFPFYINKETCVELTETKLSTATTSPWLYTNRRCCTVVRSGVVGLGLAAVVRGADTVAGGTQATQKAVCMLCLRKKPETEVLRAHGHRIWG